MANKTKTADLSVRAAFALFQGVIVAMALPLLYFLFPTFVSSHLAVVLFLLLPVFSFLTSSFSNWFLQYLYCGGVSIQRIFTGAAVSPIAAILLVGLSYFLPFLRQPISQLIPESSQETPEETLFSRNIWGYSFYLFWAGVYAQTFSSGMIAACP